uniref:Uncharacterized protein n=2 Tax=Lygus hesperus TaxID=30085 RepID=A0A146L3Z1_LYGHE
MALVFFTFCCYVLLCSACVWIRDTPLSLLPQPPPLHPPFSIIFVLGGSAFDSSTASDACCSSGVYGYANTPRVDAIDIYCSLPGSTFISIPHSTYLSNCTFYAVLSFVFPIVVPFPTPVVVSPVVLEHPPPPIVSG